MSANAHLCLYVVRMASEQIDNLPIPRMHPFGPFLYVFNNNLKPIVPEREKGNTPVSTAVQEQTDSEEHRYVWRPLSDVVNNTLSKQSCN
jgi:hypothetical protein